MLLFCVELYLCKLGTGSDTLSPHASELAGALVDMHNEGLISVVYTVSGIRALALLSKGILVNTDMMLIFTVSGHRTRLKSQSFPGIPDTIMIDQLTDYAYRIELCI